MSFFSAVFTRALASRNYRLYFAGQLVSLAGTWMQQIAMIWLAYRLSNSAAVLGMVGFASQIPILLLGPFAGVVTDRFDRRRILVATQFLSLLQAVVLAGLTWLGRISPEWLIGMAFVLGTINALDLPTRQAFSVQLVDKREDLANAIALNSLLMNSARFIGPALAGFAVATIGEAWCFAINAVSYLAVIVALLAGLYLASRKDTARLARRASAAVLLAGAALSTFALNHLLVLAFPIVMVLGFAVITVIAGSNTLIQVQVEDAYRGRVMAIFSMAFLGIAPLGSFAVGHLAHFVGVQPALLACGIVTLAVGLNARRRRRAGG